MPSDQNSDQNLASALSRLAYHREPAVGPVVTAALTRGRQIRRRRWQAAGSVAAVAVLGAGGAFALAAHTGGQPGPAAAGSESPIFRQLSNRIHQLIPDAKLRPLTYPGAAPDVASAVFDDGAGLADLGVTVSRYSHGVPAGLEYFCPSRLTAVDYLSCSRTTSADGTVVVLYKGYVSSFGPPGTHGSVQQWSITAFRPDGLTIELGEDDTRADPPDITAAKPTRSAPPLSPTQLRQLVDGPGWESVASFTSEYANPPVSSAVLKPMALRALPSGVTGGDSGGLNAGGYDYATTVTVGGRSALLTFRVSTTVQSNWPGNPCQTAHPPLSAARLSDCLHEIRPDGWEFYATAVSASADDPAGNQWVAGLSMPGGRVLEVIETPTNGSGEPIATDQPPLSAEQLYAMVHDPVWAALKE